MERLTKRGKTHPEYVYMATELIGECKGGCPKFCAAASKCIQVTERTCPILQIFDRLAKYEYTGLSPEEIKTLQEITNGINN